MRKLMVMISMLALVAVVTAPVLFYTGSITLDVNKIILNTATIVWFASALLWIGRKKEAAGDS